MWTIIAFICFLNLLCVWTRIYCQLQSHLLCVLFKVGLFGYLDCQLQSHICCVYYSRLTYLDTVVCTYRLLLLWRLSEYLLVLRGLPEYLCCYGRVSVCLVITEGFPCVMLRAEGIRRLLANPQSSQQAFLRICPLYYQLNLNL